MIHADFSTDELAALLDGPERDGPVAAAATPEVPDSLSVSGEDSSGGEAASPGRPPRIVDRPIPGPSIASRFGRRGPCGASRGYLRPRSGARQ